MSFFNSFFNSFISPFLPPPPPPPPPPLLWTASGLFHGSPIIITADSSHGGAISSLTWNGTQFINAQDDGREMQTALQYDWQGENNNPTEGGSLGDQPGFSSSLILGESGSGSVLTGSVQAALWHPINGNKLSDTVFNKTVQIGWDGIPNLIHDHIDIVPGSNHSFAAIEVLTAYLPPQFNKMLDLDPEKETYSALAGNLVQNPTLTNDEGHDAIVAAIDSQHALGMWSVSGVQLGATFLPSTIKIDGGWSSINNPQAGHSYEYDVFVAVGTTADVAAAIHQEWLTATIINDIDVTMYGVNPTPAEFNLQFLGAQMAAAENVGLNPTVYASEALGLVFAFGNETGSHAFATTYGPAALDDAAFAAAAANAVFGPTQTNSTPRAISDWVHNWEAFYANNGIPGNAHPSADQIDLAARGAAWGDTVGVALDSHIGLVGIGIDPHHLISAA
jgi:hypothetical protein